MKALVWAVCVVACAVSGGVCRAQTTGGDDGLARLGSLFQETPGREAASLALTLDDVEQIALARSPEIAVALRRVEVAQAHVPVAGALDDPMAMYRGWGVPLRQPWDFNDAQNMFSVSQTFSGAGKRALRTSIAGSEVDVAKAQLDEVRLDVRVRVHKAFDDLVLAQKEMEIHQQHMGIARQAIEAARIQYTVGKVPQQDMLKAQMALTLLAEHMIRFDHDGALAQAHLDTLLGRDPETPVRVTGEFAVADALPEARTLNSLALQLRPDLIAAQRAAQRSHTEQALAKKAYVPDFTLSGGYMLMPAGSATRNDYMVEGSINLPWLNHRKHDAEIAEATARTTEQDAELSSLRNVVFGQIQEALVEAEAVQKLAHVYHDQLQPQAEATLESSVIAYENNKTSLLDLLDSQMTLINVNLAWLAAVAEFDSRLADLEMATGTPLKPSTTPATEMKP